MYTGFIRRRHSVDTLDPVYLHIDLICISHHTGQVQGAGAGTPKLLNCTDPGTLGLLKMPAEVPLLTTRRAVAADDAAKERA